MDDARPEEEAALADALMRFLEGGARPLRAPGLTIAAAYRASAAVAERRRRRGERPVGRKMGFTNTSLWEPRGIPGPMWNWVWDSTVHRLPLSVPFSLAGLVEPKIEPEIVLGLGSAPSPGMGAAEIIESVGWVAHAFEVVHVPFGTWDLAYPEAIAGFGLHGALLLGPRHEVGPNRANWAEGLGRFQIALLRHGEPADTGHATAVLGGPLAALSHLAEAAAAAGHPLEAGEMVSTGTLTDALPIAPGETWSTRIEGLPLEGIEASFA